MNLIAVTGHVRLDAGTSAWLAGALESRLRSFVGRPFLGITCLAMGADQIFARAVLSLSGEFDVILPARDYPAEMAKSSGAESFSELIGAARNVCTMAYEVSSREAYRAASEEMLHRSDLLLAAWNGEPSRSVGDTADVVGMAQAMGRRVEVFWPSGLSRVSQTG